MSRARESRDRQRADEPTSEAPPAPVSPPSLTPAGMRQLQRQAGNRAVADMVAHSPRPSLARFKISPLWIRGLEGDQEKKYKELSGGATDTDKISDENLEKLATFFTEEVGNTTTAAQFTRALTLRKSTAPPPKELAPESPEQLKLRETRLLSEGFDKLGGKDTWAKLEPKVKEWWKKFKENEAKETFAAAYKANRMSARQIDLGGRGGRFQVDKLSGEKGATITLSRGIQGIEQRMNPENFNDQEGASHKNERGLHSMSASLLDHRRGSISKQLKFYDNAIVLFMPAPAEDDLKIVAAIASLEDHDVAFLREVKSKMTRLQLAQSSDMGTTLKDTSTEIDKPQFKYGVAGTIIRKEGGIGMPATATELEARGVNALEYTKILDVGVTTVNEIVMAYRSHASKAFPVYARWDGTQFHLLDADLNPKNQILSDTGEITDGAPPKQVATSLEKPRQDLKLEREMWAAQTSIRKQIDNPKRLREYLETLTLEQRAELKKCYLAGTYLGDDNRLSDVLEKRVVDLIDDIDKVG